MQGDAQALQRVLTNLLDNALRHSRERVDITTQRVNGTVTVEVVDDGPGFAEADLPRVFEPLFRGDRARGGSHAGLGLAIARRLRPRPRRGRAGRQRRWRRRPPHGPPARRLRRQAASGISA